MLELITEKVRSKDGTLIAYEKSGEGFPLVLVHGTLGVASRWKPIIPTLAKHFTVYAMDRRGRGESGDTENYTLEREFEDIAALIDSIGVKVNLLGHSYGGLCVLGAALLTPNVHKVIAYEPPPAPVPDRVFDKIQALLDSGDPEGALTVFLRDAVRMPPAELEGFKATPVFPSRVAIAHTLPREFRAVQNFQINEEQFKQLTVPVNFFLGGESPAFAKSNYEVWQAILPYSRITVLPGQQHIAMDTAPDLFVREVISFLKSS